MYHRTPLHMHITINELIAQTNKLTNTVHFLLSYAISLVCDCVGFGDAVYRYELPFGKLHKLESDSIYRNGNRIQFLLFFFISKTFGTDDHAMATTAAATTTTTLTTIAIAHGLCNIHNFFYRLVFIPSVDII